MARYLAMAKWNAKGAAGTRTDGFANRAAATRGIWESMGATVESVYYSTTSDEWDVFAIVDGVTSDQVFAVANTVMSGGAVDRAWAIELRTGEEADRALAMKVLYTPPSQT